MTTTHAFRDLSGNRPQTVPSLRPARTLDIGVDLDGVVYDFVNALRFYIHLVTGRPTSELGAPLQWNFYEDWGYDLRQFLDLFNAGVNSGVIFSVGRPFDGVREGLQALLNDGHRIHIITDRASVGNPGVAEAATRAYLSRHDLRFTSLTLSPDKTAVPTDVFIDDRDKNLYALRDAGVDIVVRQHAYNDHVDVPDNRRVPNFATFVHQVRELAAA